MNTSVSFEADGQTRHLQHNNVPHPRLPTVTQRGSQRHTANLEKFNLVQPAGSQGKQDTEI